MIRLRRVSTVVLTSFAFLITVAWAQAQDIYVSQVAAGAGTGADAADAYAVTFFNTSSNWGSGAGQIGPGVTVHLVGTISSSLVVHRAGIAGNVITIKFEPGAFMSAPNWNQGGTNGDAAIFTTFSNITIDGGSGGYIQATSNGTGLATQLYNVGVEVSNADNVTVQNLTVNNLYTRVSGSDASGSGVGGVGIYYVDACNNGLVNNCTIHDVYIGVSIAYETCSNFEVKNCTISNMGDGVVVGSDNSGYTLTGALIHNNTLTMGANWEGAPSIHRECIHVFAVQDSPPANLDGVQIYANTFTGDLANNATAYCFLEGYVYSPLVYNNIFTQPNANSGGNGYLAFKGTEGGFATNNTFIGYTGSTEVALNSETDVLGSALGHNLTVSDNIFDNCATAIDDTGPVIVSSDYNNFYNAQGFFSEIYGTLATFAEWASATGFDSHGNTLNPNLNPSTNVPQPPSGAIDTGTPEAGYSVDIVGTTRPQGAAWDMGALEYIPTAPVITSGFTESGTQGSSFTYTITSTDSPTSFAASGLPTGLMLNTSTGAITGTPTVSGTFVVTISATNGGTGSAYLTIDVNQITPVITSMLTASGTQGSAFAYTITANNVPASFSATGLPAGLTVDTTTGNISGTPTAYGSFNVTIGATNTAGTGTAVLALTIAAEAPVITSTGNADTYEGLPFTYTIVAANAPTSFTATGLPAGLTINTTTGVISGTPTSLGTSSIMLSATNSTGTGTKTLTLNVTTEPVPGINSATTGTATTSVPYSYTITATNLPTSFTATGLPAGLTINTTTGIISGTPTASGVSTVHLGAINVGGTGTGTLTLTVNALARPVINSPTTANGAPGSPFTYTITIATSPATPTFNATGLPSGLNVNTTTGVISGTPTAAGTTSVTISATNAAGTTTASLSIVVAIPPAPPVIGGSSSVSAGQGGSFSYSITATNAPTSYGASGLPPGLSVNTNTGLISGTPTVLGVFIVTISATNSIGTVTGNLSIDVLAPTTRLVNLSARTTAGTASTTLIAGFYISGGSKSVLVRGIGPSLSLFSVPGVLPDPQLAIYSGSTSIFTGSAWGGAATLAAAFAQVGAFALPTSSADAALLETLPTGSYTAQVSGISGDSGIALAEIYDADPNYLTSSSRLTNLSARSNVGTGANILIAGFAVAGTGTETVLVRGDGPALSAFGVAGALATPQLTLFDSAGNAIATNTGWGGSTTLSNTFALVGAFQLPAGSSDCALVATLPPGSYTAQVSGVNGTTGVALVEIYEVPQ